MRVVITGMGIVSPLGNDLETFWQSLVSGHSGLELFHDPGLKHLKCQMAGKVNDTVISEFFTPRQLKRMDRFCQLAMIAAKMAWQDDKGPFNKKVNQTTGVIFGTGIGGISTWDNSLANAIDSENSSKTNAFTIPRIMNTAAAAQIAMELNLKGMNLTLNTACASGAHAIGMAFKEIRAGNTHCMLCGGTEAPITAKILKAWEVLGVLSTENKTTAVKPFDKHRTGFVLSEGAAALVLESLNSAVQNKNKIYAEIIGFGSNCDAHHLTAPEINGQAGAIQLALQDAGILPQKIDYINAHGTATRANDHVETMAIKKVFGKNAFHIPVSATKSMTGHAMGASSAMEVIATILCIQNDQIHPTINYQTPDPDCDLDYVPLTVRAKSITHAISNSFGFGGSNAVLVIKKWKT